MYLAVARNAAYAPALDKFRSRSIVVGVLVRKACRVMASCENKPMVASIPALAILGGGLFGGISTILGWLNLVPLWLSYPGELLATPAAGAVDIYAFYAISVVGNVIFYGALSFGVGTGVGKLTRRDEQGVALAAVPECPICGHRWAAPTSPECPNCGHPRAFAGQIQRTMRCKKCRYDLTGNITGVCPECGEPV